MLAAKTGKKKINRVRKRRSAVKVAGLKKLVRVITLGGDAVKDSE